MAKLSGYLPALGREWRQLRYSFLIQGQLLWFPSATIFLLWAIFAQGVARDLPVTILDQDQSSLSRQLVRMIEASPGLRVAASELSFTAAQSAVREGRVQAVVRIPRDFSKFVKTGQSAEVSAWYNAQFLLTGNVVSRELRTIVFTLSGQVEAKRRLGLGDSPQVVALKLSPVQARRDSLFNPELNYIPFLVIGLAFAVLQMFAMLAAVRTVGHELRRGTVSAWLATAGGHIAPALLAKLTLPTLSLTLVGWASLAGLHGWLGWPMPGSWPLLLLGLFLLVVAYQGLGLLVLGLTSNYRLSSSVAAFFTAPAFAFAGQTFPLASMPAAAETWGHALPLTAALRLQIEQAVRGSPPAESIPELAILGGVAVISIGLSLPLLARRARNPQSWGKR